MAGPQGFEPASGDGPPVEPAARAGELRTAYEGLLQIRRLLGGGEGRPAPWELRSAPRSVALVLEAAGFPPSAVDARGGRCRTGYRVTAGPGGDPAGTGTGRTGAGTDADADRVTVTWTGPPGSGAAGEEQDRLTACAAELERHGWECLLYRGPRGRRFLEVEPPR
ncbi:hypothetical protein ABZZ17_01250 [Streptomyces sp. NPDC006512]|uniref:hypothetical protein n=1 Tax=Streptomyces sp. NPDC006512 TaxID=3154307 RepID=UPI00339DFCD9